MPSHPLFILICILNLSAFWEKLKRPFLVIFHISHHELGPF